MGKGFEEFQPIFGEAKGEWESRKASGQPPHQLLPFLFRVYALDHSQLRIHLSDFHSYTWECVRTVQHLEDLRDIIGVGGSWEEFVDYLIASISSENVKLILGALNSNTDSGGPLFLLASSFLFFIFLNYDGKKCIKLPGLHCNTDASFVAKVQWTGKCFLRWDFGQDKMLSCWEFESVGNLSTSKDDIGATSAKLVAHKSKGMPLISIPLNRLTGTAANDAMADLSLELFKAFKNKQNEVVKGCNVFLLNEWDPYLICIQMIC